MDARGGRLQGAGSPDKETAEGMVAGGQWRMEAVRGRGLAMQARPNIIPADHKPALRRQKTGVRGSEGGEHLPGTGGGKRGPAGRTDFHRNSAHLQSQGRYRRHEGEAFRFGQSPRDVGALGGLVGQPDGAAAISREPRDQPAQLRRLRGAGPQWIERGTEENQRRCPRLAGRRDSHLKRLPRGGGHHFNHGRGSAGGNRNRPIERRIKGEDEVCHGDLLCVESSATASAAKRYRRSQQTDEEPPLGQSMARKNGKDGGNVACGG